MANKSYKTTSWGRKYADVVTCPARGLVLFVTPGRTAKDQWNFDVENEDGRRLGSVQHEENGSSAEFWRKIEARRLSDVK